MEKNACIQREPPFAKNQGRLKQLFATVKSSTGVLLHHFAAKCHLFLTWQEQSWLHSTRTESKDARMLCLTALTCKACRAAKCPNAGRIKVSRSVGNGGRTLVSAVPSSLRFFKALQRFKTYNMSSLAQNLTRCSQITA